MRVALSISFSWSLTPGSDGQAALDGWVSVAPLHLDLTSSDLLARRETFSKVFGGEFPPSSFHPPCFRIEAPMPSSRTTSFMRALAFATLAALSFQQARAQGAGETIFHRYRVLEPTVRKAGKEVQARRFDEARRILEPVLKEVPDHAEAHFLLAAMAYESRDFTGALAHIETSEQSLKGLDQRYAAVLAKMKEDDEEDARVTQDSLMNLVGAGYDSIDDILQDKRQHLKDLETKNGSMPNRERAFTVPSAYSFLHGNCLYRLARPSEAATQYKLAIQADPKSAKAWNNLINLYWEGKDFGQARTALAEADAAGVAIQPRLKQSVQNAK